VTQSALEAHFCRSADSSSFYKFFGETEPWLRGPRKWWQKNGYFLMVGQVGQAFQPVIRFSDTFGKKKITAWKAVPARRFAAGM